MLFTFKIGAKVLRRTLCIYVLFAYAFFETSTIKGHPPTAMVYDGVGGL